VISKSRCIGFALAALGLFACNQDEKLPLQPNPGAEGSGAARLQLPTLPPGYLVGSGSGQQALFALTISGEGMDPIRKSWILSAGQHDPVLVPGIPAGKIRFFQGLLIKIDSAGGDTVVTHEGSDSAYIQRDQVNDVLLYLRQGGSGTAHICVEVEGWPADSTCIRPPDTTYLPNVAGCYNLQVGKPGPDGADSVFTGKLRIYQWDSSLTATVTWSPGIVDSAYGTVYPGGTVYFGGIGGGQIQFKAYLDSGAVLRGYLMDNARGIYGNAAATRTGCDTIIEPPIDSSTRACFAISQTLSKGKSGTGRLALASVGAMYWGIFHWDGFDGEYTGWDYLHGSLMDTARMDLHMHPPKGMLNAGVAADTLSYRIDILPSGTFQGTVATVVPAGRDIGTWKATRTACKENDFSL
jgi:hypothetical protein